MTAILQTMTARKRIVYTFILLFLNSLLTPSFVFALTSGPAQPETQTFSQAETSDMVNLFTGDFSYNIPLLELPGPNGGYPLHLNYQAGIGVDQEASWVGLGWNLNPGAITRQVRGIPDDFKGDEVRQEIQMKPDINVGLMVGGNLEVAGFDPELGVSVGMNYNTYRGISYSVGADIMAVLSKTSLKDKEMVNNGKKDTLSTHSLSSSISLGANLDTKGGLTVSGNLGIGGAANRALFGLNGGMQYNSIKGGSDLQLTPYASRSFSVDVQRKDKEGNKITKTINGSQTYKTIRSGSFSFSHSGFSPKIPFGSNSFGMTFDVKLGGSLFTIFGNAVVKGAYSQTTFDENKTVGAYGSYYHHIAADNKNRLLDFNTEKDVALSEATQNLSQTGLLQDIYVVNGQGFSGMFRAKMNHIPMLGDKKVKSESHNGSIGTDVPLFKIGANGTYMQTKEESGVWYSSETDLGINKSESEGNGASFKMYGEALPVDTNTLSDADIFNPSNIDHNKNKFLAQKNVVNTLSKTNSNSSIISIQSAYLKKGSTAPELDVSIITSNGEEPALDRSKHKDHHIGAFIATNEGGARYIYGLPAYNNSKKEVTRSVKEPRNIYGHYSSQVDVRTSPKNLSSTNKFEQVMETPAFTYAHLLTAIVGPDYVDVTGDGFTEDDLGYWVKFTYKKVDDKFKWRAPYLDGNYSPGSLSDIEDDKGNYSIGDKEIYILAKAETATHIALFNTSDREDGLSAYTTELASSTENANNGTRSKQQKLDNIELYTRKAYNLKSGDPLYFKRSPLKKVHFNYTGEDGIGYNLCKGTPNSVAIGQGKLTLHSLHFTYGKTNRSYSNPYKFYYNEGGDKDSYHTDSQDRWGTYRRLSNGLNEVFFPYTDQLESKETLGYYAGMWSISKIKLPSGADIHIEYESDDYAYVQEKEAMEMVKLTDGSGENEGGIKNLSSFLKFRAPNWMNSSNAQEGFNELFDFDGKGNAQVAYSARLLLSKDRYRWNDIKGYFKVNKRNISYSSGLITINTNEGVPSRYHPFELAAFQYIQASEPKLLGSLNTFDDPTSSEAVIMESLFAVVNLAEQLFRALTGYFNYCRITGVASKINLSYSFLRLKSSKTKNDQKHLCKYGGGHRVSQIAMYDGWSQDKQVVYGQVYNYERYNEKRNRYESTGVAAYEPLIGGEEIPHRLPVYTVREVALRNNDVSFIELPFNENFFPSPIVGYSQVEVLDLASAKALASKTSNGSLLKKVEGITPLSSFETIARSKKGKVVHEFYTAKDFPVRTAKTDIRKEAPGKNELRDLVQFVSERKFDASQGFCIINNDMHGKPKSMSFYAQEADGSISTTPTSWTKYKYLNEYLTSDDSTKLKLISKIPTGTYDEKGNLSSSKKEQYVGLEIDTFVGSSKYFTQTISGGLNFNLDAIPLAFVVIPFVALIPDVFISKENVTTFTTNKVIHQSGILESVESFHDGVYSLQENKLWDQNTGDVLVSKNTTHFYEREKDSMALEKEKTLFNVNIPAYYKYRRMDKASVNENLKFSANLQKYEQREELTGNGHPLNDPNPNIFIAESKSGDADYMKHLIAGDEFLVKSESESNPRKAVFIGLTKENKPAFELLLATQDTANTFDFRLIRSGNRNSLGVKAEEYVTLDTPTVLLVERQIEEPQEVKRVFITPTYQ
ncbi:hypothetical protein [Flammeovirga aprica]|uniref:Uncharacterized protein n=1 Tax=Flammeovirga aprica JL-4 TaxID=694437 RepID=A0A7X9RZS6_9BACT|nr:hypothetical protein [Flammeovirga aprica]NME71705.1 hypothetical protein [Flammeovirga aprica JL-4]